MKKKPEAVRGFAELLGIVEKLGGRGGCPWDRKQTFATMRSCLVEETCETLEAAELGEMEKLKSELGDLLYLVLFYVRLADQRGSFRLVDVLREIRRKLIRRHPAVFATRTKCAAEEAHRLWHERKRLEHRRGERQSVLDGIPSSLPSLQKARKVQSRAASAGFDWPSLRELLPKIDEETREFLNSVTGGRREKIEEELGDLIFTLVNVARFLALDPELTLERSTLKFSRRFRILEKRLRDRGLPPGTASPAEMNRIWDEIKREGKGDR